MSGAGTAPRSRALRACHSSPASSLSRKSHLAAREQRDRQAIAVEGAIAGQRGEPWPGHKDAHEVERVGTGE